MTKPKPATTIAATGDKTILNAALLSDAAAPVPVGVPVERVVEPVPVVLPLEPAARVELTTAEVATAERVEVPSSTLM